MKINKKGFMLAEVTVVATLAATVILLMYASSIRTINAYKERENYFDIDTIYATGYIFDYMIESNTINTFIDSISNTNKKSNFNTPSDIDNQIFEIITQYGVTDIRFIKSNKTSIDSLKSTIKSEANYHRTFLNYINNYVSNNTSNTNDKYLLIIERVINNNYYYYSVEV